MVRPKTRKNIKFEKRALFLKNNSPGLKADFPQHVKQSMKSTIHKCIVNVTPVTNPTPYTKLVKQMVKSQIRLLLGISISRIFRENSPYCLLPIAFVLPTCISIPMPWAGPGPVVPTHAERHGPWPGIENQ